jgi:hypothetical protein
MAASVNNEPEVGKLQLSKQDLRLSVAMCTEFVNLSVKLTGKIDFAATAMRAYVTNGMVSENNLGLR